MKTLALAVLFLGTLAGCATIEGLGRDISAGSRAVADAL
ncbi:MAG: entericidin EcnA/B family protein [Pseudomonadota bacterium]